MYENVAKLILRLMVGGLMLFHGIYKATHGIAPIKGMLAVHHLPEFFGYGVYVGEILAPIFLIVGWKSRWWAGIIALNMVTAIYLAHGKDLFAVNLQGAWAIELPMLFLLSALVIVLMGSGKYAIMRD
ncbi:MAG: putative oxidoreductase [Campylobacterota bacterium]|nr:putative oxidoreductase [Campylobacterota bacterium]